MTDKDVLNSNAQLPDIRKRSWDTKKSKAAKLANLLIEAEDILVALDEYQMYNNQCYPDIEDMMLEIGTLRARYQDFVDNNLEILDIDLDK